jgi:integrative and conjugative element protein (TIGR02256 family)
MTTYVNLPFKTGGTFDASQLQNSAAREFALTVAGLPYIRLVECLSATTSSKREVVTVDVEVERPQRVCHPIKRNERLAVAFSEDPNAIPRVLALREDFPSVPHLNLETFERPKSLCLYEGDPREIMLRLTPIQLIERIRQWLTLTSRGELHQSDQPLEPLLLSSLGTLILPEAAYRNLTSSKNIPVLISRCSREKEQPWMLIAEIEGPENRGGTSPFLCMGYVTPPKTHGVLRSQPKSLSDLADLVSDTGYDLIAEVRGRLREWCKDKAQIVRFSKSLPIFFIALPKTRVSEGKIESFETWAFVCGQNITTVGVELGIWEVAEGTIGLCLSPDDQKRGASVGLDPLTPVRSFTRTNAAVLSGNEKPDDFRIVQVGAGAIGSHLHQNLVRAGIGKWTLVDNDRLLPHNLARHTLDGRAQGFFKAEYLSIVANDMIDDDPICDSINVDVLVPGEQEAHLEENFNQADVIIDASASLAVARHIALDLPSTARRISAFFTPSGKATVVLAEDSERKLPLDLLEMQYYRAINGDENLHDHLSKEGDPPLRYGQSCRDLTSRIPQDIVALHAALASNRLKKILPGSEPSACIWSLDTESGAVTPYNIPTSPMEAFDCGHWRVRTDRWFLEKLNDLRSGKLPNETGGILLGSHDMRRKILYLVDTIPSPPDSTEWPAVYIRGRKGLAEQVNEVERRTAGNLSYVGEWHSHPDGATTRSSTDDQKAFAWLSQHMAQAGLPALMIIVGQQNQATYIGEMER